MRELKFTAALLIVLRVCLSAQPTVSFTFDDGVTGDMPGYAFEQWNKMVLDHLDQANVKAIFFVTGANKLDEKGQYLLRTWNNKGHKLANHTFTHANYNSEHITFEKFKNEFLQTDTVIKKYDGYIPLFRFPYLKEGNSVEKITLFRELLQNQNYRNGYVTIDASDWYIDSRLRKRLKENPDADIEPFRQFYLEHLLSRAVYYEELSFNLTGRHINHTLLLHHNLAAALFLGDLIKLFKENGWRIIDAKDAYDDEIFQSNPANVPAGESLVWALAKEIGKFESILRYPAEDSKYEEEIMNRLGL
ncbi:MAG TPA: polysaccharide deacetylase family protein [Ohtaekwangia sp.]|nr:polysaccharide deacetylase family protein [Ohtaekwangia sp.]